MSNTIHVFDFLEATDSPSVPSVCAVFGDEPFLKRLVLKRARQLVLNDDEEDIPFSLLDGNAAQWRDVIDELCTVSLFGGGGTRLVVVEQADDFVSQNRTQLEDYAAEPRSSGVLILEVGTWASNTRLYKAIDKSGLQIDCRAPQKKAGNRSVVDEGRIRKWLTEWSKVQHNVSLQPQAVSLLLEIEENEFGMLDQDLAKLALYVEPGGKISPEMVRDIVGGWRTKTTWDLIDAAVDGDAGEALRQLHRLLHAGDHPVALFGQISWSLRRFAAATRIYQRGEQIGQKISLPDALEQAGFRKWPREAIANAQRQITQIGRERAGKIYRWLLEADLALKGSHSNPDRARFVLERLLLRMSNQLPKAARSHR